MLVQISLGIDERARAKTLRSVRCTFYMPLMALSTPHPREGKTLLGEGVRRHVEPSRLRMIVRRSTLCLRKRPKWPRSRWVAQHPRRTQAEVIAQDLHFGFLM
jgi:hypothetical protein